MRGLGLIGKLALAAALLLGAGSFAHAAEGDKDDETRTFRFELSALGQRAGEAVMRIGAPTLVGGTMLRAIRIDAETSGLAKKFVNTRTASTTWVNTRWLPVRARWDSMWDDAKRVVKTKFEGRRVHAVSERDGKLHRKINHHTKQPGADIISIFPWLMAQDMTPGTNYVIEVFDGFRVYNLAIEVGSATELHTPMGVRSAIPLRGTVTRGDYKREMVVYLSADEERMPLKLVFKYGLLGQVEAVLVSARKV